MCGGGIKELQRNTTNKGVVGGAARQACSLDNECYFDTMNLAEFSAVDRWTVTQICSINNYYVRLFVYFMIYSCKHVTEHTPPTCIALDLLSCSFLNY